MKKRKGEGGRGRQKRGKRVMRARGGTLRRRR